MGRFTPYTSPKRPIAPFHAVCDRIVRGKVLIAVSIVFLNVAAGALSVRPP